MVIFSDDIITVILIGMDIEHVPVKLDTIKFHTMIYNYKKIYTRIFKEFLFNTNGTFPYCELIERIFNRYRISGVLESCRKKDTFAIGANISFEKSIKPKMDKDVWIELIAIGKKECANFR